jgi:hypothetical protein
MPSNSLCSRAYKYQYLLRTYSSCVRSFPFFPFLPSQYALFYSSISDGDCTPITMSVKVVYSQTSNWLLVG